MPRLVTALVASCLLSSIQASYLPTSTFDREKRSDGITWGPCDPALEKLKAYNTTMDCGNLTVPLDYGDESKGSIELNLLRAHAPKGPSRGSVLLNYGGPGDAGRKTLAGDLLLAFTVTGFVHDLVVFDPRGTENTIPMICFNATETTGASQSNSNASDTAIGEIWAGEENYSDYCLQRNGSIGAYMGTAATARDLLSVVDALNEDGLLRYYGISYGSVLGTTFASMFPERVGRMLLDGIANAHEYYHAVETEWISDTDKVWSEFFVGCANTPSACPLARDGKTAAQLEEEFYQWLYGLKQEPFILTLDTLQTYTITKQFIFQYIYQPATWSNVSKIIDASYQRNATLVAELIEAMPKSITSGITGQGGDGIKCSEKTVRTATLEEWLPEVSKIEATSRIIGDVVAEGETRCARWKMSAVEIYQGDFRAKTKTPILFASNEFDPVTPLKSAQNMTSGFEGSFLLVNKNGHGHSTRQQLSVCILQNTAKYFIDGTLPAPGTVCEPSAPLFGDITPADVLAMVNGGGN